eukprot:1154199-Pelagomonas_calceolata.AAC.3
MFTHTGAHVLAGPTALCAVLLLCTGVHEAGLDLPLGPISHPQPQLRGRAFRCGASLAKSVLPTPAAVVWGWRAAGAAAAAAAAAAGAA